MLRDRATAHSADDAAPLAPAPPWRGEARRDVVATLSWTGSGRATPAKLQLGINLRTTTFMSPPSLQPAHRELLEEMRRGQPLAHVHHKRKARRCARACSTKTKIVLTVLTFGLQFGYLFEVSNGWQTVRTVCQTEPNSLVSQQFGE